jgi:MoCo/4Fe-4S cofactor protein with predicted Tat translocation signal
MSKMWRTLSEWFRSEEYRAHNADEFTPHRATEEEQSGMDRRQFLGLLSASAAFAATACSNHRDEGELSPYNKQAENAIPGMDVHYASAVAIAGQSWPVLIKTRDGRPLKLNGNPDHNLTRGKTDAKVQASLMSLYEPDRLKSPRQAGNDVSWSAAEKSLLEAIQKAANAQQEIAVLTAPVTSPSLAKLLQDLAVKYPTFRHYSTSSVRSSDALRAAKDVLGTAALPAYDYAKAKFIVSVENDFLGSEATLDSRRAFAENRAVVDGKDLGTLAVVEGDFSATGMNADLRLHLRADAHVHFLAALATELVRKTPEMSAILGSITAHGSLADVAKQSGWSDEQVSQLIQGLIKNRGASFVSVGERLPYEAHVLGFAINQALGALGSLVSLNGAWSPAVALTTPAGINALRKSLADKKVGVLISWGVNPVHQFDGEAWDQAYKAVPSFHFANLEDETALVAQTALPLAHALESWNDHGDRLGYLSIQQPMIAPLFQGRQPEDYLVAVLLGQAFSDKLFRNYIKANWANTIAPAAGAALSAQDFWNAALHDGFAKISVAPIAYNASLLATLRLPKAGQDFALTLKASQFLADGELAHVGWLQETPHPVSKLTWDNAILVSPALAKKMGFRLFPDRAKWDYDMAEVTVDGRKVTGVVLPQPGLADDQIVIELGYGRKAAGSIGTDVGFNASSLLGSAGQSLWIHSGATIRKTGDTYALAITQENNAIDAVDMGVPMILAEKIEDAHLKRGIVREATVEEFQSNPLVIKEMENDNYRSINRDFKYEGVKWAMSIDLNKCIGCAECVVSCNVENNVPVVGKESVIIGREMHWIRIDRYYAGSPEAPIASLQPMLCQHCDNAPCENVCPVLATAHSEEGLNDIAYNRCVGTRYCANNCGYKVRKFNYYNYRDQFAKEHQEQPVVALAHNPEVTVRSRGVVEKCSFCVQRINLGRAESRRKGEVWKGQGVISACQEACPTGAIAFGNINDLKSEVRRRKDHQLTYRMLASTGVEPNIHYQAKLRLQGKHS